MKKINKAVCLALSVMMLAAAASGYGGLCCRRG